ncbi:MAG: cupin domain-containing protein [Beijerinckiaceae bacterium]|jgi:hypothetical protein
MKIVYIALVGIGVILAGAGYAEIVHYRGNTQAFVGVVNPADVVLKPAPIPAEWVLEGDPQTMGQEIAHTDDGSTKVYVWQTTKSRFVWHYQADEIVTVLDGEVFLTDKSKTERRLGPGDVAFFPAGTEVLWRVPDHIRKIATLKTNLPEPVGGAVRWLHMAKNFVMPSPALASSLGK